MIILHLLALLAAAVLSVYIAEQAVIAQRIKNFLFGKDISYLKNPLHYYVKLNPTWFYLLTPVWLIIMLYAYIYTFFKELLDCPFCLSLWIGIGFGLLIGQTLLLSLVLAPIAVLLTHVVWKYINE